MHAHKRDYKSDTNAGNRLIASELFNTLTTCGVEFFCGVPDSLLKHFCAYVNDHANNHTITANEGNAVALAIGQYLATGKLPLVYMQNSGLGNAINPLLSLADREVYGIPMLLMIGWRGKPNVKDEPQHIKQGRVMLSMLDAMEIPYKILPKDQNLTQQIIKDICNNSLKEKRPHAIIIEKDSFEPYKLNNKPENNYPLSRSEVIDLITKSVSDRTTIVSTTGFASRELFEQRVNNNQGHEKDFLTVGGMGHASQIALGIALNTNRPTYCIDGDGSLLMHMGSLTTNGQIASDNFKHILINNGAHHSVGGQKTTAFAIDIPSIAKACGYKNIYCAAQKEELIFALEEIKNCSGSAFVEVKVNLDVRDNLSRPTTTPADNKNALMEFLHNAL